MDFSANHIGFVIASAPGGLRGGNIQAALAQFRVEISGVGATPPARKASSVSVIT